MEEPIQDNPKALSAWTVAFLIAAYGALFGVAASGAALVISVPVGLLVAGLSLAVVAGGARRADRRAAAMQAGFARKMRHQEASTAERLATAETNRHADAQRLAGVLEASRDHAVLFLDLDGRITGSNRSTELVFGYPAEELEGRHIRNLLSDPVADVAALRDLQRQLIEGGAGGTCELDGRHRDGHTFPVSLSMALRSFESGEPSGLVLVAYDVTRFREERELILRNRELERASRLKSEFLANMSHELRTPLNSVIGFSEVLLDGYFGELNEQQQDYIRDIHHSGRHLLDLINDILDLSKIEAGRMDLQLESFDLREAIDRVVNMVDAQAKIKNIELDVRIGEGAGLLHADRGRFKQIVLNLLSNALKFTPENGHVRIEVESIRGEVRVRVEDTGIGIPPGSLPTIFDKFQQVEGGYRRQYGGTGLGLAIVKEFMHLHGGRVDVESELGQGSAFVLYFPEVPSPVDAPAALDEGEEASEAAASPVESASMSDGDDPADRDVAGSRRSIAPDPPTPPAADPAPSSVRRPAAGTSADADPSPRRSVVPSASADDETETASDDGSIPRVLVVDDDPFQLKRFFQYLSPPLRVETAMTGAQAVERVRQSPPSVVILKIFLPDMDGWEVLRSIKEIPEARSIPIVITSLGSEGDRGLVLGAADYFVKPVPRRELLKCLGSLPLRIPGRTTPPKVLLVDNDPKDIRLVESYLRPAGYELEVEREARAASRRIRESRPDVVLLDLRLPGGAAFDLAGTIRETEDRKAPIVILTNGRLSVDEKITLMEQVYGLSSHRPFERETLLREVAAVLRMWGGDPGTGGAPWSTADEGALGEG